MTVDHGAAGLGTNLHIVFDLEALLSDIHLAGPLSVVSLLDCICVVMFDVADAVHYAMTNMILVL